MGILELVDIVVSQDIAGGMAEQPNQDIQEFQAIQV